MSASWRLLSKCDPVRGLNDPEGRRGASSAKPRVVGGPSCYEFRTKLFPWLRTTEILTIFPVGIPEPELDTTESGGAGWNPNSLRDSNHPHQPGSARSFFRALQNHSGKSRRVRGPLAAPGANWDSCSFERSAHPVQGRRAGGPLYLSWRV